MEFRAVAWVPSVNEFILIDEALHDYIEQRGFAWTSDQGGFCTWYYVLPSQRDRLRSLLLGDERFAPFVRDDNTAPYYIDVDAGFEERVREGEKLHP